MTTNQWIEYIQNLIDNSPKDIHSDNLFERTNHGVSCQFLKDLLTGLTAKNLDGVNELVNRLNKLSQIPTTASDAHNYWNNPASPIRNFLIVRFIDYPENP